MPIYAYRCRVCDTEFERMQSFSDTSMPTCPEGHDDVVRLLKPPAIHFKGSGWYITDSKKGSGRENGTNGTSRTGERSETSKAETDTTD